jgi:hypothetical protein
MITIGKPDVFGWEASVRGLRNPMNSWSISDSLWDIRSDKAEIEVFYRIGAHDLKLMRSLAKAGDDHAKFLRMIHVQADITAPLYWWKEFDTYKVGTVANSTSTMHKVHSKPIEVSDFSVDDFTFEDMGLDVSLAGMFHCAASDCELLRRKYLETQDKRYWKALIQLLPQGYNQKRTVDLNYQVLAHMYFARRNHKLDEWHDFCDWVLTLPYFREIVLQEEHDGE